MNGAQLRDLLMSDEYKQDLDQISSYLASIAPERPVLYCLAKHLWIRKHPFQLEAKREAKRRGKVDLLIDDKVRIEFKGSYDFGMEELDQELRKHGDKSLKEMWEHARLNKRSIGFNIGLKIYEDICVKKSDIFVWIICARDLSKVVPDIRKRVCMYKPQLAWNNPRHPYPDPTYLPIADRFLQVLNEEVIAEGGKSFSVLEAAIETNGDIPSTYHFRICEILP